MSVNTQLQSPVTESQTRDSIRNSKHKPSSHLASEATSNTAPVTSGPAKASLPSGVALEPESDKPALRSAIAGSAASPSTMDKRELAGNASQGAAAHSPIPTSTTGSEHGPNTSMDKIDGSNSAQGTVQPKKPANVPLLVGPRTWASQAVVASFIGGGVAGAVSRTVVSPLERLKILLQVQSSGRTDYKMSIPKALAKIWREEGFKGMMAGNGTNCIRIVPYSAVQFGSYNLYKPYFEASPDTPLSAPRRLACGALAGITSVCATYPLDIVRTRLSIQSASFQGLTAAQVAERKLPGMWTTLATMYKTEGGVGALYRGIIPTVAGVAPYVGLNFMVYESVREYFTPEGQQNPTSVGKLCAGAISGAVAQTATYPFDVLRRRFQINTMSGMGYQYKSIFDAVRVIVAQEGVAGLYKGIAPNLLKVAPSMASSWLSFEMTRDFFISLKPVFPVDEPASSA